MGQMRIDNKELVAPADELTVRELKKVAKIPANERLFEKKGGKVLDDDDVVRTTDTELGTVPSWERG